MRKRQVQAAEDRRETNRRAVQERQVRQDAYSLDVATREEAVSKQREALGKAKTNKAYAEILTVMNTTKADNSKLESEILKLMEEIQTLEAEGAAIDAEKVEFVAAVEVSEGQLKEVEEKRRAEREELEASRAKCAEQIPPTALSIFTRVAQHHDGEAMAPVIKLHPKRHEYACTGCNLQITLEVVSTLKKNNELQLCSSCGRVLYIENGAAG